MADADSGPSGGLAKSDGGSILPAAGGAVNGISPSATTKTKTGKPGDGAAGDIVGGPLMTVVVRNEFYRDGFRNLIKIAIVEAAIIVALIITFIAYIDTVRSQNHYFATTADGRIMPMTPLEIAGNMNDSALISWAAQAASEVMTFGFNDYQRRLQYSARFFTQPGWAYFTEALQKSRTIESITALQQVVSAEPSSAPIILRQGPYLGKYHWQVKLPLKVSYQSGTESRVDYPEVTLVITRVSELENPSGVAIEQWV
jgi:intracellular multiplication protein IcmL